MVNMSSIHLFVFYSNKNNEDFNGFSYSLELRAQME